MRKTPLLLALSAALIAAPVAVAHPEAPAPEKHMPGKAPHREGPKGTLHLAQACVVADATATGVQVGPLSVNRHMRDALAGAPTFVVKIDATTTIRLVGRARHLPPGSTPRRLPKIGGFADLTVGDRVTVRIRAPRGTAAADLPAAFRIVDHGPSKRCAPPATPPATPEEPAPSL